MKVDQLDQKLEEMILKLNDDLDKENVEDFFSKEMPIRKALGIEQADVDALMQEGEFCYQHQEWDRAIKNFYYLTFLEPEQPMHYLKLGITLSQINKFPEAIEILGLGSLAAPQVAEFPLYIGSCFLQMGDIEQAKEAFNNCLEIAKQLQDPESQEIEKLAEEALQSLK